MKALALTSLALLCVVGGPACAFDMVRHNMRPTRVDTARQGASPTSGALTAQNHRPASGEPGRLNLSTTGASQRYSQQLQNYMAQRPHALGMAGHVLRATSAASSSVVGRLK